MFGLLISELSLETKEEAERGRSQRRAFLGLCLASALMWKTDSAAIITHPRRPENPGWDFETFGKANFRCHFSKQCTLLLRLGAWMEAFVAPAASSALSACPIIREAVVCVERGLREVNNPWPF